MIVNPKVVCYRMLGNSNLRRNTNKIYRKTHNVLIYSKHSFFGGEGWSSFLGKRNISVPTRICVQRTN